MVRKKIRQQYKVNDKTMEFPYGQRVIPSQEYKVNNKTMEFPNCQREIHAPEYKVHD